jgi:hypothetical protein
VLYGVVLLATLVTYGRLAPEDTYSVTRSGVGGALSRGVTYLNFPVALAALALVWLCVRGWVAWLVAATCAVVAVPGVVSPDDLDAHPVNAVPAVGVVVALALTWRGVGPARGDDGGGEAPTEGTSAAPALGAVPRGVRLDVVRVVLIVLLAVVSVPWACAALGFHAGDVPGLGAVFRSSEPTPGEPGLASVHLGLHEGLFGAQLAATALLLTTVRPLPRGLSPYLALMFCYGAAILVKDGWNEQVVKRGWSGTQTPDVLEPAPTLSWAGLLLLALLVHVLWFRREQARPRPGGRRGRATSAP